MAKHVSIYINEAKFTADEDTVNAVIASIEARGFTYDDTTQGFVSPGFYASEKDARDGIKAVTEGVLG